MSEVLTPHTTFGELATAHHEIRGFLDEFSDPAMDCSEIAERLCLAMARHRSACTESILRRAAALGPDHEQQARLLMLATHGVEQLVDRLRLPARDPQLIDSLLHALWTLVQEHERLELELTLAQS